MALSCQLVSPDPHGSQCVERDFERGFRAQTLGAARRRLGPRGSRAGPRPGAAAGRTGDLPSEPEAPPARRRVGPRPPRSRGEAPSATATVGSGAKAPGSLVSFLSQGLSSGPRGQALPRPRTRPEWASPQAPHRETRGTTPSEAARPRGSRGEPVTAGARVPGPCQPRSGAPHFRRRPPAD